MSGSSVSFFAAVAAAMLAVSAGAREMLVLQCGSDWCESGEDVRRVFTSPEFRAALGRKFELAARYVRARRVRETDGKRESKDDFALSKILVYGKRLY